MKRRWIQLLAAVFYNCNISGFFTGKISKLDTKGVCVPGLNCYSCPGAIGACPLGSLQNAIAKSSYRFPLYMLGFLLLAGLFLGRLICGFLCPFGFLQDLLHKIPFPKIKKNRITRALSYVKYVILVVLVILIPLINGIPGFCKYICPAGTLEAGVPLILLNEKLQEKIGFLFSWKVFVLAAILLLCMFCFRAFCRFLCPLGAIYSLFNPIAFFGIKVDREKCNGCNACVHTCKMDVKKIGDRECIQCGECKQKCPQNAIGYGLRMEKTKGGVSCRHS